MMIAVTEALSEASLAAAGSLITRPEILARALLAGGTDEQKAEWLPKIAAGDPLCAISITEPDYGSDVASLMLRGTPTEDGWLLNGAKTWCTFAGKAGVLMVVARTNPDRSAGHRGLSVFLVEKPSYEGHEFTFVQEPGASCTVAPFRLSAIVGCTPSISRSRISSCPTRISSDVRADSARGST
jgi:(2S)-methylsuccinyl-CoA dehydrogenase